MDVIANGYAGENGAKVFDADERISAFCQWPVI